MDITEKEEPMVYDDMSFFQKEDLPRVKHYITNIILEKEFWKRWTIIPVECSTNIFDGIIFNNIKDYNSGVTFVSIDLSESRNNTDVYVPLKGLLYGVYVVFVKDKYQTIRYKLKPDCYKDLDSELSAQLAGIIADSIKYCTVSISPDFQFLQQKICSLSTQTIVTEDCTFFDIFKDHYNKNIKNISPDFVVLYNDSFVETGNFIDAYQKRKSDKSFESALYNTYNLSKIKEIVQAPNEVNGYITSIMDSLSQFKIDIKTIKTRKELFMSVINTNDIIGLMLTRLEQILDKSDILYNCIHKCLLLEDLYIDINVIMSVLQIIKVNVPHSTSNLIIDENKIKTQELKKKLYLLQKSTEPSEKLKSLTKNAYQFCYSDNVENQQVIWFRNLAENDHKLRVKVTSKQSHTNLVENLKIQLEFEEHYNEYLTLYAKGLSRQLISLSQVIANFTEYGFANEKSVRENVVSFLESTWNLQYWQLSETLNEYQKNIDSVIHFHHTLVSNTNVNQTLLPSWPVTTDISNVGVVLNKDTYETVVEKLNKQLPCHLEYQHLPFIVSQLQSSHFAVPYKGTLPSALIQLWNTRLYEEYNSLKNNYDHLYKINKSKLHSVINWIDSSKQPTFSHFYNHVQQIAFKDDRSFIDEYFKEFVQNTLLTQRSDVFDDLSQLVSNNNQRMYNFVKQMGDQVYLKKLYISSQGVFEKVFSSLLQQVYVKLKKYKIFEGVLNDIGKDFIKSAKIFDEYCYPQNIIGDIIRVNVVEKKTHNVVSEIRENIFKSQAENTGIAISAIYRYSSTLFINGLLKWICQQKGDWLLLQSLHIEDFRGQFPTYIEYDNIKLLPATYLIGLFLTVSFILFSNIKIVDFINSNHINDSDVDFHVKLLTKTLYTFIKPYFLIKENIHGPDHFFKTKKQKHSLNVAISSIFNQEDITNNNVDFPSQDYNPLFNLFITEAQNQNIQLDINFFLNNDASKVMKQYVHKLQSLNFTCISKLNENVIFNKDHAFAYIYDSYMVSCNDELRLSVSQDVLKNIDLYQCRIILVDNHNYYHINKKETIDLNLSNTEANILHGENVGEAYSLHKAMKNLSLKEKAEEEEEEEEESVIDTDQFEKKQQQQQQDLINIIQNKSPTTNNNNNNVIAEYKSSKETEESDFDVDIEPIYPLEPLSINNTVSSSVPCVVSINDPLINSLDTVVVEEETEKNVSIIVQNRDRDLRKHLLAVSCFFPQER
jgi:hypothetical protein